MLRMSHPLVLVDAFSGLLFVNKVLLPCCLVSQTNGIQCVRNYFFVSLNVLCMLTIFSTELII